MNNLCKKQVFCGTCIQILQAVFSPNIPIQHKSHHFSILVTVRQISKKPWIMSHHILYCMYILTMLITCTFSHHLVTLTHASEWCHVRKEHDIECLVFMRTRRASLVLDMFSTSEIYIMLIIFSSFATGLSILELSVWSWDMNWHMDSTIQVIFMLVLTSRKQCHRSEIGHKISYKNGCCFESVVSWNHPLKDIVLQIDQVINSPARIYII